MTPVAFIHTSPAAIPPLMQFYGERAPDLEITNLLDDGLLRSLARGDTETPQRRLGEMVAVAKSTYGATAALVTCSSVTREMMRNLLAASDIPLVKIDDPMADEAVQAGSRLAVVVTFRPTIQPTTNLLQDAAKRVGRTVDLEMLVLPEAYDALLSGNAELHDRMLLGAIEEKAGSGIDGVVLAQVSMARLLGRLEVSLPVPVFSSLPSSLRRMREILV